MRTPFIAGNWKMFKTVREAEAYVDALAPLIKDVQGVDVAICVPFTALQPCIAHAAGTGIAVYAQNMHEAPGGAYTGEVSARMLADIDVDGVVLGHSERRQHFCETDRALQQKLPAALAAGLSPILCVGETEEERERGDTERRLRHQVQEALHGLSSDDIAKITIAYEPVWAIGTGKVATPEQAQEAIGFVRALVADRAKEAAEVVRIQYGGSMKAENAAELLALPDVDGGLVGGASLDPESFAGIVRAAGTA
jgi:triosephosphate isomerase (TIM)